MLAEMLNSKIAFSPSPARFGFHPGFAAGFCERAARACQPDAAFFVASTPTPDPSPPRASRAGGGAKFGALCKFQIQKSSFLSLADPALCDIVEKDH